MSPSPCPPWDPEERPMNRSPKQKPMTSAAATGEHDEGLDQRLSERIAFCLIHRGLFGGWRWVRSHGDSFDPVWKA